MRARHCSDEELLAYLDGELGLLSRYRCARHLRKCWACREQLGQVESQIRRLARLAREEQERVCPEAAAAKRRFLASVAFEAAPAASTARIVNWPRVAASLGLGALAFAGGLTYWRHNSESISVAPPPAAATTPAPPLPTPAPSGENEAKAIAPPELLELKPAPLRRWSPESLAEAELEATSVLCAYAAQSLAAFSFERDPVRGLRIEGIVDDQSRKDILTSGFTAAIRAAPWSANLTVAADLSPVVLPRAAGPEHTVRAGRSAAEAWLRETLRSRGETDAVAPTVNAILNGALRRAGTAAAAAWTLHRLVERFPDSTLPGLSPRGRELLARLASAQLSQLREAAAAEREWMAAWFPDVSPAPTPDLFEAVSQWERLANRLMTCCDEPPHDTQTALRDLAALLSGIEKHLSSGDFIARHWTSLAGERLTQAQPSTK